MLCPAHGEKTPSCSVSLGPDGTIRAHCFSCDWSSDALGLIAKVHNLELRGPGFREVLMLGAELAGLQDLLDSLRGDKPYEPHERPAPRPARPEDEPQYPDAGELATLWSMCVPVDQDAEVAALLDGRGLSVAHVRELDLARALPLNAKPPRWASYRGDRETAQSWLLTGHRLILPVYDVHGQHRSVRAWRVRDGDTPKRLPPSGRKAAALVLANSDALMWLQHSEDLPYVAPTMKLIVTEGEPDFLVRATTNRYEAVIGLMSGSWHQGFADKIPTGSEVDVVTHRDAAGDRYAKEVITSIKNSGVVVFRTERQS